MTNMLVSSGGEDRCWSAAMDKDRLRRRYLSLLVPALSRVHAGHPSGSDQLLDRARAVKQVADACLVQAMAADRKARRKSVSRAPLNAFHVARLEKSSLSCRLLRKAKARSKVRAAQNSPRTIPSLPPRLHAAIHDPRFAPPIHTEIRPQPSESGAGSETPVIPDQMQLKRLRRVLQQQDSYMSSGQAFPPSIDEAETDVEDNSISNPASLLSQAARYIIALQVQVDALETLSR
ncbi:hypothetical protein KP509_29G082800 [Ceratopteris richardii]|uniref:IBH1-like N-terminal domain-containing protein n=1 Tax=Ceratopteris richardii TaxID=49495 RepID=A0A8T2R9Z4_CERRI|nr:hypothetical protein KP509_29G082800 [Ceratopteris richardii]